VHGQFLIDSHWKKSIYQGIATYLGGTCGMEIRLSLGVARDPSKAGVELIVLGREEANG
jgi:hypothetical protein